MTGKVFFFMAHAAAPALRVLWLLGNRMRKAGSGTRL